MQRIVEIFRASNEAPILFTILCEKMDVTADVVKREHKGTATEWDTARLTVLRFLFGTEIMKAENILTIDKRKSLLWLRRQKVGRELRTYIENIITETRYTYETTVASESVRLLLQAYKRAESLLYVEEIEVLYDHNS